MADGLWPYEHLPWTRYVFFSYKNVMQNDPQLVIRECTLVRGQNTYNQETKSNSCTLCVQLVHVQVLISLSSSISLQLFDLLQENEAWKPI